MSFLEFHQVGGMPFMVILTLSLIINLLIVGYVSFLTVTKKPVHLALIELIRHVGGFAAAFGALSTVIGLFFALQALSEATDVIPFNVIMGGLAVGLITVEYGLVIFVISLLAFMVLKYVNRSQDTKL